MKIYITILILILPMHVIANPKLNNHKTTNLITPVNYFINHVTKLEKINDYLNKFKTASVVGVSGIGKTQLVRTYAYENSKNYNLVWFIDGSLDINQEFLKLAKSLNKERGAGITENGNVVKNLVLEYLKNKSDWLLVIDNLKIGDNKKIKDIINWEHNGHVIFASQDKHYLSHVIEINNFNRENCVKLAESILDEPSNTKIDFLSKNLKGYPILVVQTAQLLNQFKGVEMETYKRKVIESSDKIRLNVDLAMSKLPPSAIDLLYQISLINNQSFSKSLLEYIANDKTTIDDDLYQISKYSLISSVNANEQNPIFEMHDVIVQTIIEIIGDQKAKKVLENTIDNFLVSTPHTISEFHVFRDGKTIAENFKVISDHAEKYKINLLKEMHLKSYLITIYNNQSNYLEIEKLVNWFDENEQKKNFNITSMSNDEKARYAAYLQCIARYYRNRYSDFDKSIKYATQAEGVQEDVNGYEELKTDLFYQLSLNNLKIGDTKVASQYVPKLLNTTFFNNIDAMLSFLSGDYKKSLDRIDDVIKQRLKKIKKDDLVLTSDYLLRAQILNFIGEYQNAKEQINQLYDMHSSKEKDHVIFARIYTQMAKSELGLNQILDASDHITKSIEIFLKDKERNAQKDDYSENLYLADCYVVQGDILLNQDKAEQAIASYRDAQKIYFYLYKDKRSNVEQVSYLYTQGAKASCQTKDIYHYKCFGEPQIDDFGKDHPNTIDMLKYCDKYKMDLWQEVD